MQQEIEVQGLRLSPHQKRLWLWQQRGHRGQARAVVQLEGAFDEEAVHRALRRVIARHDSLRTSFYREPGMKVPFQVINEEADLFWQVVDLRHLPDERTREQAAGDAVRRIVDPDWETRPLIRGTFCRLTDVSGRLILEMPGLCADHWSLANVAAELSLLLDLGNDGTVDEAPVQYGQFSEWHHELLEGEEAEQGRAWWAGRKLTSNQVVLLPFERTDRLDGLDAASQAVQRLLSAADLERLRDAAAAAQVSLPLVLFACWMVPLYRTTGRTDLICWWRTEGRSFEELQGGIGLFECWLPLHLRMEGNPALQDLVALIAREQGQAEDWQHYYAVEQGEEEAEAVRAGIGFEYGRRAKPNRTASGAVTLAESSFCAEPLKLRLAALEDEAGLALTWHFDADRIPAVMVQALADRFLELSRRLPECLTLSIDEVDLVGTRERIRLTREFNQTTSPLDPMLPIHRLIEAQAVCRPASSAVVAGERRLSYDELNRQANRVARGLRRRGVQPGDRVGLCFDRSTEMIVAMLGVLKAGAAYVPVDPAHASVRLAPQMAQSGAGILVAQAPSDQVRPIFHGMTLDLSELVADEPDGNLDLVLSPDALAYVIFTSGSTGQPKGVAVSHRNLVNYTLAISKQLDPQEPLQFATVSTLSADLGYSAIFPALTSGGCLHVIGYETATDGRLFGAYLAEHPIDVLKIVPSHFKALLATGDGRALWPRKFLLFGGEALSWGLADQVRRQATCTVINHYGPTETTVGALTAVVTDDAVMRLARTVPIGRPLDNLEAYILDDRQEPVPIGVAGELYLGGQGLARGYWNQPDRTAERFVPNPHASQPGARLYRTGDRTRRLPDGSIEFLGRVDHQVKIRGFRIELGEIESVLRQHPAVQDAVVAVRENHQGDPFLAAYLVGPGTEGESRVIQDFLRSQLPDYMVPAAATVLPALPLTANGKVDRGALPEPDREGPDSRRFMAPATATEEIVAGIWCDVLKRDAVGVQDNFFDLGGHSLLATQVMSRVRQALRVDLPLRTLFEAPTVARLVQVAEAARGTDLAEPLPAPQPIPRSGPVPLSFAQQRLWVLAQLEPDSTAYIIPIALRVRGPLDVEALERSFRAVMRRHEALRTTFHSLNGVPMQVIAAEPAFTLPLIDLQHLPEEERDRAAIRLAAVEAERPFDLRYGPLLRVSLIRLRPTEHLLLLTLHHIVSDAWSAHVLVREMTALYASHVEGRPSPLPELPLQYADLSQWQRAWMAGPLLERDLAFWKTVLGGELPVMDLPTDRPRPAVQTSRGAMVSSTLDPARAAELSALGRRMGATLYMMLLSAFFMLLARMTGQSDLIVGTPIANRTRKETEGLIGFFVNTLAIRTQISRDASSAEVIAAVREACLEAYAHQETPFEKLVDVLHPTRDVSRSPIFQVMFDLQNAPASELEVSGLEFEPIEIDSTTAKFDLSMTVQQTEGGLVVAIEYNTDLFDSVTVEGLLARYESILDALVRDVRTPVSALPLLTGAERQQVVGVWNRTGRVYPDAAVPVQLA
ncbi:MAG: non-ribosomal peptide synthetase, partial [Nitrospira sp.]